MFVEENISSKASENLESALQQCRGGTLFKGSSKKQEQLSLIQQYIRHLFYERLNKPNLDQVAELIERLPWHEEEEFIMRTIL
jgi:hypothetical protein